ncbi:MAG: prepilin-type N-terminal cleavage/methylation domain-containing protein, partial [Candidatus Poribacteria bacterium]
MAKIAKKNENGFTLIEILLISVIVLLIAVSITMLFTGGRKTWTSADKGSETIQNAVIGMEKLVREVKNSPGLTYFDPSEIRFAILRKDTTDIDGDGNVTEYVTKYARAKRDGSYLKYGERDTDSDNDGDWALSNLAYPVTSLSFIFKKLDGSDAIPGTDVVTDVKSVLISMTTSEDGITIPLKSSTYLVMEEATEETRNFDGTPDEPGEPGPDDHHFNEGDEETPSGDPPPPPGANGDGVGGWGISDYAVYGDRKVGIANSVVINGNVGTRNLSGAAFNSSNSSKIYGYLAVKGSLNMSNSGAINGNSIAAACVSPSSYSTNFANSARTNSHFWTLKNITMSNSSRINGTVSQLAGATITCYNSSGYTER